MNLFYTQRFVPLRIAKDCRPQEHLRPILSLFCITVATTIYIRSDITILGFLRTDAEVGVYTLVSEMYSIVKGLVNALIMVTIPRLSNYLGKKKSAAYDALMNKLFGVLCVFLFPCVVGLSLLSSDVVTLFGSPEYAEVILSASVYFIILLLMKNQTVCNIVKDMADRLKRTE